MTWLREFLNTKAGQVVGIAAALCFVLLMILVVKNSFSSAAEVASTDRIYICSETGKTFGHEVTAGEKYPIKSPYSGKNTGYPAEPCFWNKDGTSKKKPTYVFVKTYAGERVPTFCPDCGRLVIGLNPAPAKGDTPPPTEAEYNKIRGTR